jgi:signal transduction histidine kinase
LLQAEERERRRIAKELHDSTAQDLVAVMMSLDSVRENIAGSAAQEARRLEDNQAVLEKCAHDIRTLSYLLHPPRLDEAGLTGAIRHYASGLAERSGIAMTLDLPEDLGRLAEEEELALFRVVQECLGNIHRHAHSPTAAIRLSRDRATSVLEVRDAGCGIPPAVLAAAEGSGPGLGVGIPAMRERLRQIGGRLEIESNSRGTTVRAILPTSKT